MHGKARFIALGATLLTLGSASFAYAESRTTSASKPDTDVIALCQAAQQGSLSPEDRAWAQRCVRVVEEGARQVRPAPSVTASPAPGSGAPPPSSAPPAVCGSGGKPTAANTGVPAGTPLTVVNGDLVVTTPGTVVDARDIHGFLIIRASNVMVRRTVVRGRSTSGNHPVIDVQSGTDVVVENSEVANQYPAPTVDGVDGSNVRLSCMNIHGTVDGLKLGSNSRLEHSYVHDMTWFASDPNHGGGQTHNDALQILDGTNITITGNNLSPGGKANAAIQVTQDFGPVANLQITGNWGDGGGCTFNLAHKGGTSLTIGVANNRFGRTSFYACPVLLSTRTTLVGSGNVWDDDGRPVPVQRHD